MRVSLIFLVDFIVGKILHFNYLYGCENLVAGIEGGKEAEGV